MIKEAFRELTRERHRGAIPWLDVMRSVAVLLVIGGHTLELGFHGVAEKAFDWGWTGVDLFFVLSGYLIGVQLWKERETTGTLDLRRFFIRRSLRIWPLYFFALACYLVFDLLTHRPLRGLPADTFFLSNYLRSQVKGGWSLSTEEQFYLMFPVLLLLLRRAKSAKLMVLPLAWLAVLPFLRHAKLANHAPGISIGALIYSPFHTHSDGLAMGVIIALLATTWPAIFRNRKLVSLIAGTMIAGGIVVHARGHAEFSYTCLALIFGGLVIWGLHSTIANSSLTWRGFHIVSRLSFGMYLNHLVLIETMQTRVYSFIRLRATNPVVFLFAFGLIVAGSLLASFFTFALIERPFLLLRDALLAKRKEQRGALAAVAVGA